MSIYDAKKIRAVFLYVLNNLGQTDMLTIFKMIYFANLDHLKDYGRQIMPDTFIAMPQGPVPSFLKDAIDKQRGESYMRRDNVDVLEGCFQKTRLPYILTPLCEPEMDELSASDVICLNKALSENKGLTPSMLSEKSHDAAWQNASGNRPMSIMDMAAASGASDEILSYISEHREFDELMS